MTPAQITGLGAVAVIVASLVFGFVLRAFMSRSLQRWAQKTQSELDDALVTSLRRPVVLWSLLVGVLVALRIPDLPDRAKSLGEDIVAAVLILSITLWLADLSVRLLVATSKSRSGEVVRATGLAQNVLRIAILVVGGLVLLSTLGVSIAPLLTTLGIGGLAVALGLQETLSNVFAGIHISLARNIRVGDFIKLESGEEGFVEDIGWRATRIRVLSNNMVLIPNNRLAQNVVTNYSLPTIDLAVLVQVGVHYGSDLADVERVTCEVGREVMKEVPGAVPEFEPFIRYHTFGDSSINFSVILRAQQFVDNYLIKHEFIKRLKARFDREGIVIPFPIRALNISQEGAEALAAVRAGNEPKREASAEVPGS